MAVINLFCYFLHQVINFTPTNSYLDDCLFNQMVAHAQKHPNKPRNAEGWILKGSNYHKPTCVSATFDSLVKLGLLRKERRNLGTCVKYPTVNPGTVTCIIALILFPNVRETNTWVLDSGFRTVDCRFQSLMAISGSPFVSWIPRIPFSTSKNLLESWFHCQTFAGFRILITLYRAKFSLPLICT